jgi:predicted nucleic acid-binding protein
MSPVFLDTVGLLAEWDSSDQWHALARQAFQTMLASRRPMVTTTFVLLECGNAASRKPYRPSVARFREQMQAGNRIVVPTEMDWQSAWTAYARGGPSAAGIVDQVSFVVMRRLSITDVFTNDRHFQSGGFNILF